MAITIQTSTFQADHRQTDQRRWIKEQHTLSNGRVVEFCYLAPAALQDSDITATVQSRAMTLLDDLANIEIAANISAVASNGVLASPSFIYSTAAQNIVVLRDTYRSMTDREAAMVGEYLSALTDAQLRNAFSFTAGQVTTLRNNRLTPAANLAASLRSTVGE